MALVNIYIGRHRARKHKPKKQLLIFLNGIKIFRFMDITLQIDKGQVIGHLEVKDQNGALMPISGASYSSSDGGIFSVAGDDNSFAIVPAGVGSATFTYSANGLTGQGTVTVVAAPSVATSIEFVIDQPQP